MTQIHATAIAIDEQAILLCGESGSGKSDLALRLIEQGAQLVSDDRAELINRGAELVAFPPPSIKGLLEVRELGVLRFHSIDSAIVRLVVELDSTHPLERMPELEMKTIEGVKIACVCLNPFYQSTPAKVSLALAVALGHIERIE